MTTSLDQAARDRIAGRTDQTLFVNAGAGSGKTTALVSRVSTLVLTDGVRMRDIAAVTFTEKAGAELRDRLREAFEGAYGDQARSTAERDTAAIALDDLDSATIGTLHSFAQRILSQHPVEAGLPPLVEVLDEVGSSVAFEERWAGIQTALLDDVDVREPLLLGMALGLKLKHVRSLTLALGRDWDLIESHVLNEADAPISLPPFSEFVRELRQASALRRYCTDDSDNLLAVLDELDAIADRLEAAPDTESALTILRTVGGRKLGRKGRKTSWTEPIDSIREHVMGLGDEATAAVDRVLDGCLRAVARWVGRTVLETAQERRRSGQLEFHDLLVITRDVLRREADVRAALHDRYQRLLLDEFQDTDPIQIELAVRIAGGRDAGAAWQDITIPEGRLFVVGDAKQSIYRFRRASIATYLDAEERIGERETLSTNFRTTAPVLDWVNAVFSQLIQAEPQAQPAYEPLLPHRIDASPSGPSVTILGADAHADLPTAHASILRERESADVAATVQSVIDDGWQVWDEKLETWRAATHHDVVVLVPARTSLPFLEDAFETAGIPYRAEASSLVYQASEVRDLLAAARAIADATDELSLVTALRSPLFGCGDDDLWRWRQARGRFTLYSTAEDETLQTGPVGSAITYLKQLSFDARWMAPSEVLTRLVTDRRMYEAAATGPRARDSWRRLRFVVDQARAWSEVAGGGLRSYLAWAAHQGQEASRVAEAVLPETDVDAVRIMTIHAAKGLEFPIVIMSGMTAQGRNPSGVRLLWSDTGYAVKLGASLQTEDFEAAAPIDEQMDRYERTRLLYVAATRARDHLVVSLHRKDGSGTKTAALQIAEAGGSTAGGPFHLTAVAAAPEDAPSHSATVTVPDWETWHADAVASQEASHAIHVVSASGLEGTEPVVAFATPADDRSGLAKGLRNVELPPWSKGRYGSAIGRAVHGVLQVVDLATGADVDTLVAAQALAEGVADHQPLVRDLVASALASEIVQRAAAREHWRETYVGFTQSDGTLLEGYVDLIYREDDESLVIVDYKTDAVPAEAIDSRVTYYRPQLEAYAAALRASLESEGRVELALLFLRPDGALEQFIRLERSDTDETDPSKP